MLEDGIARYEKDEKMVEPPQYVCSNLLVKNILYDSKIRISRVQHIRSAEMRT